MDLSELSARLDKAEAQIDILTRALQLSLASARPTSTWLDAKLAKIDAAHPTRKDNADDQ